MKGRKTWERGYAAGLIDGEGCIQIRKVMKKGHNHLSYQLQVSMNQSDGESIDFMYGAFGGKTYQMKAYQDGRLPNYRWEIIGDKAMSFLKQILPFLRIKKAQAELGIRYQVNKVRAINQFVPQKQEDLEKYEWYYQEMRRLKTVHQPYAAVTTKRTDSLVVGSDSLVLQER